MLEERIDWLEAALERLAERDYREKAHSYFLRILLGIRSVPRDEIAALAADAERRALLSIDEHADLMQADVVVRGRLRDRDADGYLVAEVSSVVDARDVHRAARRARLLERIAGAPVVAAVAGEAPGISRSKSAHQVNWPDNGDSGVGPQPEKMPVP